MVALHSHDELVRAAPLPLYHYHRMQCVGKRPSDHHEQSQRTTGHDPTVRRAGRNGDRITCDTMSDSMKLLPTYSDHDGTPRTACLLVNSAATSQKPLPLLVWLHPSLADSDVLSLTGLPQVKFHLHSELTRCSCPNPSTSEADPDSTSCYPPAGTHRMSIRSPMMSVSAGTTGTETLTATTDPN